MDSAREIECDEVLLVLGAGIMGYMNRQRADAASEEMRKNPKSYAIPTGGKGGFLGYLMNTTEAEQLRDNMIRCGIDKTRIVDLETQALTTHENFLNSKSRIGLLNPKRVKVVTNKAHMPRALRYANQIMPEYEVSGIPTSSPWYDLPSHASEFAVWVYEKTKIPAENFIKNLSSYIRPLFRKAPSRR